MKINILIFIVAVLFLNYLNTCYSQTAKEYYQSGLTKFKNDKYSEAIQDLKKAIEINSKSNEFSKSYLQGSYSIIGTSYCNSEYYEEAIPYLNKFLELKINCEDYFTRGICYSELQENISAIEDYTNAIKLKPDFAFAYANRGIIYLNLGHREEACQDFKKALDLGDNEIKSHYKKYCN